MSGHSKWATIKHKKGAADAKRGKIFTKLIREITTIAKQGGGNTDSNPALRTAIDRARAANMPMSNVDNAIKKGTGELPGVIYEEVSFDAYAPGGVALVIDGLTDNKNRTTSEVRNILSRKNGNLGTPGSTSYMFSKKGFFSIEKNKVSEDTLMDIALEAGAEDIISDKQYHEITCSIASFEAVKGALAKNNISTVVAEITMIPTTTVAVTGADAKAILSLIEALEDHDDVQNVYANFDISDEEMEKLSAEDA